MIKTDKGEYLRKFTSEMMKGVEQYNKYPDLNEICKHVTGKFLHEHEQDFMNATWDLPFKVDIIEELEQWSTWKMKDKLEEELKQVAMGAINKHLLEKFNVKNDENSIIKLVIRVINDEDQIETYRTQQMHIKYPETSPWTYEQVMEMHSDFSKRSAVLSYFIDEKVVPIVKKNYEQKQAEDRLKRNLKAKECRQAKKQKQG